MQMVSRKHLPECCPHPILPQASGARTTLYPMAVVHSIEREARTPSLTTALSWTDAPHLMHPHCLLLRRHIS
ncbi:hypothetical protein E2C01_026295 [Portunus trituberculatus]|uniref:Uncharacterized protein n=1 Tax=Portunus trituberculatus TaxID=210409 RepID=A0A5B7EI64_PORTR|nr:hypothetical protein [Portunus trituberculatus]